MRRAASPTVKPQTKKSVSGRDGKFASAVIAWQKRAGRHHLPWQNQSDPYRVWLSEIMLQQTQVATVIPYYSKFLDKFPLVSDLAAAAQEEVMELWSGLGYYSRARNLHACAQQVRDRFNGEFPSEVADLVSLPGIGRSTAAAIAVFAFGKREAILDGNVKRVFCRHFGVDTELQAAATIARLWEIAEAELAGTDPVAYTQGLMDLGATCCTRSRPDCDACPLSKSCIALADDRCDELPKRRKRSALPTRQTTMLILRRGSSQNGEVFVQRRPDQGIWPGLLSLPESALEPGDSVLKHLQSAGLLNIVADSASGSALPEARRLADIAHTFSHYRLEIRPLLVDTEGAPGLFGAASGGQWLGLAAVADAGLPAPVKKLLLGGYGGLWVLRQ